MNGTNWMRDLSPSLKSGSILNLTIPGSHNSFTNKLYKRLPVGADQEEWIQKWAGRVGLIAKPIIRRWGICQRWDCMEQLEHGIRYFDVRLGKVVPKSSRCRGHSAKVGQDGAEGRIRILHGLYGEDISEILLDMESFLDTHRAELIILDIPHVYGLDSMDIQYLAETIEDTLGDKLIPQAKLLTFASLLDQGQVILCSDHLACLGPRVWSRSWIQNPWPNTEDIQKVNSLLTVYLENRQSNHLHVSQGILTASGQTVRQNPFTSLEDKLGRDCTRFLIDDWIPNTSQEQKLNVVSADFVDEPGFIEALLALNTDRSKGFF